MDRIVGYGGSLEEAADDLHDFAAHAALTFNGGGANVRSADNFRMIHQFAARAGLADVHVECRRAHLTAVKGGQQRVFIHRSAAGS
jgi:hypothetical protein